MDTIIGGKVKIDTTDVSSFKSQLRQANNELLKMSQQFGASSNEAVNAAKKVAGLKDAIGDAKNLVDQFNPDAKFKTLTTIVGGAASGFTALQGAMGLFGSESEDVAKSLQKVQSAMALSQGINQLGELRDGLKNAATVIKTQVVTAFSTLKGAIISTGIGLLVVSIGLMVANWEKFSAAVMKSIPGLATLGKWIGKIVEATTDWLGVTNEQTRALEELEAATKNINDSLSGQIKILEALGGKDAEVYELKKQRIENERKLMLEKAGDVDKFNDKERDSFVALNNDLKILDIQEANRKKKLIEDAAKEAKEKAKKDKEEAEKLAQEKQDRELANFAARMKGYEFLKSEEARIAKEQKQADEDYLKGTEDAANAEVDIEYNKIQKIVKAKNEANKKEIQDQKDIYAAKVQIINDAANIIVDVLGRETLAGKAIAIAQAIMNTYLAASNALKLPLPPPFPQIAAGVAIAGGLQMVKKIAEVQVPGVGGGAGIPSMSSVSPMSATSAVGSNQVTLDNRSINAMGNQALRAYVVETDISGVQKKVRRIEKQTRFG